MYNKDSIYISQIEINGTIYLSKEDAEALEKSNYTIGVNTCIGFIIAGSILVFAGCALAVYYLIFQKSKQNLKKE